jgi:hypothetical protein
LKNKHWEAITKNNEIRFHKDIFNVFVSRSDYVGSSDGNIESERMREESDMVYFMALSWTEEKHETFRIVHVPANIQIGRFPTHLVQDQVKMYRGVEV